MLMMSPISHDFIQILKRRAAWPEFSEKTQWIWLYSQCGWLKWLSMNYKGHMETEWHFECFIKTMETVFLKSKCLDIL